MAISDKFTAFTKRRNKHGLLGKSASVASYAHEIYSGCSGSTATNTFVYTLDPVITLGVTIYDDAACTQVTAGTNFLYLRDEVLGNNSYIVTTDGVVDSISPCVESYTIYTNCGEAGATTVYIRYDDVFGTGTVIYDDMNLTSPYDATTIIVHNNIKYEVGIYEPNVGKLTLVEYCTYYMNAGQGCPGTGTSLYIRIVDYTSSPSTNQKLYTDSGGLTEYNVGSFGITWYGTGTSYWLNYSQGYGISSVTNCPT